MSDKTIEEMVLAECARLCPEKDDRFDFDWGWMKNWGDWFGFYGKCDNPMFVSREPRYDEHGLFHNFPLAYRLLGLEAADKDEVINRAKEALAMQLTNFKAKYGEMNDELSDLKAKNATLVEALESIRDRASSEPVIYGLANTAIKNHKKGE